MGSHNSSLARQRDPTTLLLPQPATRPIQTALTRPVSLAHQGTSPRQMAPMPLPPPGALRYTMTVPQPRVAGTAATSATPYIELCTCDSTGCDCTYIEVPSAGTPAAAAMGTQPDRGKSGRRPSPEHAARSLTAQPQWPLQPAPGWPRSPQAPTTPKCQCECEEPGARPQLPRFESGTVGHNSGTHNSAGLGNGQAGLRDVDAARPAAGSAFAAPGFVSIAPAANNWPMRLPSQNSSMTTAPLPMLPLHAAPSTTFAAGLPGVWPLV
jgi:hypothetical protein